MPPKSVPKPKGIRYPKTKSKKINRPSPPPDRASLRLLARTSPTPLKPERIDSEATKHLGAVRGHKLNTIWEGTVAPKVYAFLDEMGLKWSVAQIIHYTELGEPCGPASLCIGVRPKSLADEDATRRPFGASIFSKSSTSPTLMSKSARLLPGIRQRLSNSYISV